MTQVPSNPHTQEVVKAALVLSFLHSPVCILQAPPEEVPPISYSISMIFFHEAPALTRRPLRIVEVLRVSVFDSMEHCHPALSSETFDSIYCPLGSFMFSSLATRSALTNAWIVPHVTKAGKRGKA